MALDLEKLSAPISADTPCGPDLRDDVAFREIEDAPGEFAGQTAADLRKVVARCVEFLARTKDQMPAIVAAQASARAGDFNVTNDLLQLIHSFATTYWDDFHPGPAEEMAIGRVNELSALARPAALILPLQRAGLARMPAPSTVEFNAAMLAQASAPVLQWTSDNESALAAKIASGAMTSVVAKTTKATHEGARLLRTIMRTIAPEAMAADVEAKATGGDDSVDPGQAASLATSIRAQVVTAAPPFKAMSDVLYDIMSIYDGHSVDSPSFGPIIAQLKSIEASVDGFLAVFPDPSTGAAEADDPAEDAPVVSGETPGAGGARPRAFIADTPRTRADVAAAIEGVLRFYVETEPSSPVPLMLRRVLTWVNKDFMELMKEIAPNGADEATRLLAIKSD